MSQEQFCPGCGRHCSLSEPHCGRGVEYARTGQLPERQHGGMHHESHMSHYQDADTNEKLIMNLRDLSHMMRVQYEGKASQKRILVLLSELSPITQRDLTERLGIQPGSASEILLKLENAGLIMRTQNASDRRTTDIQLTPAGRQLAEEAVEQRQKRHVEMFSCLSEEEQQTLLSLLERLREDWAGRMEHSHHHHRPPEHMHRGHRGPGGPEDGHRHGGFHRPHHDEPPR